MRSRFLVSAGVQFIGLAVAGILAGCAGSSPELVMKNTNERFSEGTIISAATGGTVTFDEMISDLRRVRVVYVGEKHTHPGHHEIQLRILEALAAPGTDIRLGMEMVDQSYQPVLDQWSEGQLDRETFLRKSHWYANWRFDFDLYAGLFEFAQDRHIPVIGLNIPFHIPAKIATGGLENLSDADRAYIPISIDRSNAAHRAYVENVFKHHKLKGRDRFEDFYTTQCVWEDAMAGAVARHLGDGTMVVLAGNGHIIHKFGIPDRAFSLTNAPFRTVMPVPAGKDAELGAADYIWVTAPPPKPRFHSSR